MSDSPSSLPDSKVCRGKRRGNSIIFTVDGFLMRAKRGAEGYNLRSPEAAQTLSAATQIPELKTQTSFYEVLGVGPNADPETLRKAYRRLARKHHPDVSTDPQAHENMARLNEAFETLMDSARERNTTLLAGGGFIEPSTPKAPQKPVVVRLVGPLQGHKTPIYACSFAPDTGQLVSSAFDNEILWWDEAGGCRSRKAKVESGVISVLRAFTLRPTRRGRQCRESD